MIERLDEMKKDLTELATLLNGFKSEAVQLRILDIVLGDQARGQIHRSQASEKTPGVPRRQPKSVNREDSATEDKKRKVAVGAGAPATLTQLVSGDFFDKPRTINDIINHCKDMLARTFKANEFSGKLARMVRNGNLTRSKNAENQYEYTKP